MTPTPRPRRPRPARRKSFADWFHRQSKQVKGALGGLTAVLALVVAGFTVDDRYARAGDVSGLRASVDRNALAHEIAIQNLRRAQVMDKVHDLRAREAQQRGRLMPHEKQALDRYLIEHADLTRDIEQKQRLADRLRFK
jgi:hypothetical protein